MQHKVSVIVPVYKTEKYILQCARSVFGQTYSNLEIIFVDDCSPDSSVEVVREVLGCFPQRKEQVKFIINEQKPVVCLVESLYLDKRILGIVAVNIKLELVADMLRR